MMCLSHNTEFSSFIYPCLYNPFWLVTCLSHNTEFSSLIYPCLYNPSWLVMCLSHNTEFSSLIYPCLYNSSWSVTCLSHNTEFSSLSLQVLILTFSEETDPSVVVQIVISHTGSSIKYATRILKINNNYVYETNVFTITFSECAKYIREISSLYFCIPLHFLFIFKSIYYVLHNK